MQPDIVFIGGGNMARAIIGGLRQHGQAASALAVIEPNASARQALSQDFGIRTADTLQALGASAAAPLAATIVWAVKPQVLKDAMLAARPLLSSQQCLHLSIAAGVTTASMQSWLGNDVRIVRAMPNTPALLGQGMTGLFATASASEADRSQAQAIAEAVGQTLWVEQESLLDAVTALSGSGPAYVFYFLQAMRDAGTQLGLTPEQAYQLAVATFAGASALAAQSPESPEVLRQRVTSKGGTTFAATQAMDAQHMQQHFIAAMRASHDRAREMAREFG
ncbi:pyrroline-5-carboxylate reductase [Vandammella animalimorsus]|uniref:Pyrroline-5-carboxylate reductase n=1 Tax=Vandammella animalimorsus TaxID=2029117 RepID=A0A3M6RT60_9BURK|nr:pyrroline-5-carboxylate reductase [Vandammella animalimorsus]RMX18094.1 pyrroline-5-carboxylate reductase [Vandammella animalimorsus]